MTEQVGHCSAGHHQNPWRPDDHEDQEVGEGDNPAIALDFTWRQVSAADEDHVRTRPLRGNDRKEIRGKQKHQGDQHWRHARFNCNAHEDPKECQHLRRLTDEEIVDEHIKGDE